MRRTRLALRFASSWSMVICILASATSFASKSSVVAEHFENEIEHYYLPSEWANALSRYFDSVWVEGQNGVGAPLNELAEPSAFREILKATRITDLKPRSFKTKERSIRMRIGNGTEYSVGYFNREALIRANIYNHAYLFQIAALVIEAQTKILAEGHEAEWILRVNEYLRLLNDEYKSEELQESVLWNEATAKTRTQLLTLRKKFDQVLQRQLQRETKLQLLRSSQDEALRRTSFSDVLLLFSFLESDAGKAQASEADLTQSVMTSMSQTFERPNDSLASIILSLVSSLKQEELRALDFFPALQRRASQVFIAESEALLRMPSLSPQLALAHFEILKLFRDHFDLDHPALGKNVRWFASYGSALQALTDWYRKVETEAAVSNFQSKASSKLPEDLVALKERNEAFQSQFQLKWPAINLTAMEAEKRFLSHADAEKKDVSELLFRYEKSLQPFLTRYGMRRTWWAICGGWYRNLMVQTHFSELTGASFEPVTSKEGEEPYSVVRVYSGPEGFAFYASHPTKLAPSFLEGMPKGGTLPSSVLLYLLPSREEISQIENPESAMILNPDLSKLFERVSNVPLKLKQ